MKRFVSSYFRKFQLLLAVAAASYPVHWTVSILRRGELNGVLWLYSLGFVATAFAALFVPGSIRVIYGIAVSAVYCLALLCWLLLYRGWI